MLNNENACEFDDDGDNNADDDDDDENDICSDVPCYTLKVKDSKLLSKSTVFLPCQKKLCEKQMKCHLPPLKNILTRKEIDIKEVQALPPDWALISRPSKKLENLNAKLKQQHDAIIQEVSDRCKIINEDLEVQIRLKAELLKQKLYENEHKVLDFLKRIEFPDEELTKLDKNDFEFVVKNMLEILEQNRFLIDEFYYFLIDLEKERTQKYKEVLKYEYSELHKISYLVPYELQKYFGFKILNYNQILLNDLRYYADLHQNLLIQVENKNRLCMQQYDKIHISWKYLKKREMLIKLNEMLLLRSDFELAMLKSGQARTTSNLFLRNQQQMSQITMFQSSLPLSAAQVDIWSKKIQEALESIDFCARKLMSLYKMTVVQIFNGYFEELEKLRNQICRTSVIDSDELNLLNLEISKPTIESVTQQYSNEMLQLEGEWESVITKLQQKVQITYLFLKQAGLLWDDHFDRIYDLKLLVLRDLKVLMAKNDKWQNVQEVALAVAIDNLRQASGQNYLENFLSDAFKKIDAMQNTYRSHYKAENKVILKYETMVDKESEVLLAELQQILHLFPKGAVKRQSIEVPITNEELSDNSILLENQESTFKDFLLKRTVQLEFQIDAIENWMLGLKEAMEVYITNCKSENQKLAYSWIDENNKKLAKRLEVKLAVNNSKYERIKCSVYDVRLSELKMHSERLERHKAGAEKEIADVRAQLISLQSKYQEAMTDYKLKMQETLSKIELVSNTSKARNLIRIHNNNTHKIKEKVADLYEKLESVFSAKMAKIKGSSIKFCAKIKLFYEGGNFNATEANNICKDLKKYESVIKKSEKAITKDISKYQKTAETEIEKEEAKILPVLTQCLQEFEFNDLILALIQNVQVDLKRETYNLKFFIKKAEDQLSYVQNISNQGYGNIQNLEIFEEEFKNLFSALLTLCEKIYYAPPENDVRKLSYPQIELPSGTTSQTNTKKTNSAKSQKTSKSVSKLKLNYHDYAGMLLDHVPPNVDSVMPQLCLYLLESLKLIQDESQNFYTNHPKMLNKFSVKPTYDDLMQEVTEKYNFYFIQCELFWLNTITELFKIMETGNKILPEYFTMVFDIHHKNNMDIEQTEYNKVLENVVAFTSIKLKDLRAIRKKLKSLHGYQKNQNLRDEIQAEMEEALQQLKLFNFEEEYLSPYKTNIQIRKDKYVTDYNIIKNILFNLQRDCIEPLINIPLTSQFARRLDDFEDFMEKMEKECANYDSECKPFYDKLKNLQTQSDYNLSGAVSKTIQDTLSNISAEDEQVINFDYIEIYEEDSKLKVMDIRNVEERWIWDIDEEEKIFNSNLNKISKLYSVKHDFEM